MEDRALGDGTHQGDLTTSSLPPTGSGDGRYGGILMFNPLHTRWSTALAACVVVLGGCSAGSGSDAVGGSPDALASADSADTTEARIATSTSTTSADVSTTAEVVRPGVGEEFEIAPWTLRVASFEPWDDVVPYEPEPGVEYRAYRIDLAGVYEGEGESNLEIDFVVKYYGGDGQVYADYDAYSLDSGALLSGPTVVEGGETSTSFVIAVPVSEATSDFIVIEDWGSGRVEVAVPIELSESDGEPSATDAVDVEAGGRAGLGESFELDDWVIRVVEFAPWDAVQVYEPVAGTEYIGYRILVEGVYQGEGEGSLAATLTAKYVGSDGRVYADYEASASYEEELKVETGLVVKGGTALYTMELAIPAEVIEDEFITLEGWTGSAEIDVELK